MQQQDGSLVPSAFLRHPCFSTIPACGNRRLCPPAPSFQSLPIYVRRRPTSSGLPVASGVGSAVSFEARQGNRMPCQASLNSASYSPADAMNSTRTEQLRQELNDMLVECVAVHSCQSSETGKTHFPRLTLKSGVILLFDITGTIVTRGGSLDRQTTCGAIRMQRL